VATPVQPHPQPASTAQRCPPSAPPHAPRRAVFLDRDDTLIACTDLPAPPAPAKPGDLVDPALVRLLPGVRDGCQLLADAGLALVVVTNQGVVARGGATLETVDRIHRRLDAELPGLITAFYYCPFHPSGSVPRYTREHPWRKPGGGMLLAAARALGLSLPHCFLIGDAQRDIDAGLAAGLPASHCFRVGPSTLGFAAAARAVASLAVT
jgi:histidinol-phosphate phosphatase family protein